MIQNNMERYNQISINWYSNYNPSSLKKNYKQIHIAHIETKKEVKIDWSAYDWKYQIVENVHISINAIIWLISSMSEYLKLSLFKPF